MDSVELSERLTSMYEGAKHNEQTVTLILFGIRYAKELRACDESPRAILERTDIRTSAAMEINQGIRLARHVVEI